MSPLKSFTKFPELPPELQLQIWESTIACQPSMHLFDVCVPPAVCKSAQSTTTSPSSDSHDDGHDNSHNNNNGHSDTRLSKGEDPIYLDEAIDTLYLAPVATTTTSTTGDLLSDLQASSTITQGPLFPTDPSMYKFRGSLAATCIDAAATMRKSTTGGGGTNTIYLGAPSTARGCASITYDNTQDVLHLRFVPPALRFPDASGRLTSPISAIFESVWSQELAGALHRARRVAIDVSQLWPDLGPRVFGSGEDGEEEQGGDLGEDDGVGEPAVLQGGEAEDDDAGGIDDVSLIMQDIAFLACTVQNDLEVLYLVDYRTGCCDSHSSQSPSLRARDLTNRSDDGLYRSLRNGETWEKEKTREPDVIRGVGKVWREVFDLEKLGWHEEHPGFVFAEMFAEVVKMQQGNWASDDNEDGDNAKERATFKGVRVLVVEDD
jgi:hypothetical protein